MVFATSPVEDESRQRAPLSATLGEESQAIGGDSLLYHAVGHDYRVSGGSFFQTNRFLVDELAQTVVQKLTGRAALDLYAGAGLFTLPLALNFDQVIAVEGSPHSFADLRHNAPANVKPIRASDRGVPGGARSEARARPGDRRSAARRAGRKNGARR